MTMKMTVLLGLVVAGLAPWGARAADTLDRAKEKGVLVAGVRTNAPPFGMVDPRTGETVGYDVDFLRALAERLGVKLVLKPVERNTRVSELLQGNVDIVAGNLTASRDRGSVIAYSAPYLTTGQGFLARRGAVKSLQDLSGKKIGAVAGSRSEKAAKAALPGAEVLGFEDYDKACRGLQTGAVDAITSDRAVLLDLLGRFPASDCDVPEVQISQVEYVFGVRRDDERLLGFVNQTLGELQENGQAKKIYDRWLTPPAKAPTMPRGPAYGAVVRRAATPPGLLAEDMSGIFLPNAPVSIFALDGTLVGKGTVTEVLGDQFYLDVDPAHYDLIQPGFFVAMNMTEAAAREAVAKNQKLLQGVRDDTEKAEAALAANREKEGLEKEKAGREMDRLNEESKYRLQEERERYYNLYRYYRSPDWW